MACLNCQPACILPSCATFISLGTVDLVAGTPVTIVITDTMTKRSYQQNVFVESGLSLEIGEFISPNFVYELSAYETSEGLNTPLLITPEGEDTAYECFVLNFQTITGYVPDIEVLKIPE